MTSEESSIEQMPDTRSCVVQKISDGTKECEGDGCQRNSEAVEKECRTSGGQTDMTDHFLFNRKPVKSVKDGRYVIKLRSSTDEPCSIVLNFSKFVNELLRTASE